MDELANDLYVFFYETDNRGLRRWDEIASRIARDARDGRPIDASYWVDRLALRYVDWLRERARSQAASPARYLYLRLRRELQRAAQRQPFPHTDVYPRVTEPCLIYRADRRGGAYFAFEPTTETADLSRIMPYGQLPRPIIDAKELARHRRDDLLKLARCFWDVVRPRLERPQLLTVWSIVEYVSAHYEGFTDIAAEPQEDDALEASALVARGGLRAALLPRRENPEADAILREVADEIVSAWRDPLPEVFARYRGGEEQQAIAVAIGKDKSTVSRYEAEIKADLASHAEPFLTGDDHARRRFLEIVGEKCDKRHGLSLRPGAGTETEGLDHEK